ncbi:hypothetical protein QYF36_000496 [Acer negundo]|nr:hypothetical protein QYF36_000496 [Acer negundo]
MAGSCAFELDIIATIKPHNCSVLVTLMRFRETSEKQCSLVLSRWLLEDFRQALDWEESGDENDSTLSHVGLSVTIVEG